MLRKVESTSDVNRGSEPCQSGTALTFPVFTRVVSQIDGVVRAYAHAHDDHYLTRSKFNSLLTEMITPLLYILKSPHPGSHAALDLTADFLYLVYSRLAQAHPELCTS